MIGSVKKNQSRFVKCVTSVRGYKAIKKHGSAQYDACLPCMPAGKKLGNISQQKNLIK